MPNEIRRLLFDFSEATEALQSYAQNHDVWMPAGKISRIRLGTRGKHEFHTMRGHADKVQRDHNVNNPSDDIVISFFDEASLEHSYVNLSKAFVAAALIDFCINNKILLPKEAGKNIDIDELHLCMDIHFNNPSDNASPILSLEED
jgi:hypothetical protein